jgi:hypothetical protein
METGVLKYTVSKVVAPLFESTTVTRLLLTVVEKLGAGFVRNVPGVTSEFDPSVITDRDCVAPTATCLEPAASSQAQSARTVDGISVLMNGVDPPYVSIIWSL